MKRLAGACGPGEQEAVDAWLAGKRLALFRPAYQQPNYALRYFCFMETLDEKLAA